MSHFEPLRRLSVAQVASGGDDSGNVTGEDGCGVPGTMARCPRNHAATTGLSV